MKFTPKDNLCIADTIIVSIFIISLILHIICRDKIEEIKDINDIPTSSVVHSSKRHHNINIRKENSTFSHLMDSDFGSDYTAESQRLIELPHGRDRRSQIVELLSRWAGKDFPGALAWANSLQGTLDRNQALIAVLKCGNDPIEMANCLTNLGVKLESLVTEDTNFIHRFTLGLARSQGHSYAIAWIRENMDGIHKDLQVAEVIRDYAKLDLVKAKEMIDSLPQGGLAQIKAIEGILNNIASDDLAQALRLASEYDEVTGSNENLKSVIGAISNSKIEEILRYATSLSDEKTSNQIVMYAAIQMSGRNPRKALSILDNVHRQDAASATETIIQNWALANPSEVNEYAKEMDNEPTKAHINKILVDTYIKMGQFENAAKKIETEFHSSDLHLATVALADTWISNDPIGASKWISSLPPGESQQKVIELMIQRVLVSDPAGARSWIPLVDSEITRNRLITEIDKSANR